MARNLAPRSHTHSAASASSQARLDIKFAPVPVPISDCGDRQLALAIKDRLGDDEDLKGNSTQVEVVNKTVILSGTVENDMARNYAADTARKTGCLIASIVNDLKLGLPDQVIAD